MLRKPRNGRPWLWVCMLGLIVTAMAAWWLAYENEQRLAAELERQIARAAQQVEARFGLYEYGLRGARGAILAGGGANIHRETFAAYSQSRELSREFPGARGFGFIRRWPTGHDDGELRRARGDGMPSFQLRELAPNSGDRFVIEYIYPQAANQGAAGLDIASETTRRDAAVAAARDGAVRLTAPLTLVQADQKPRQGFLIMLPMYSPGALPPDGAGRLAATLGWTYAPLLAEDVLKPLLDEFALVDLSIGEVGEPRPFFTTQQGGTELAAVPGRIVEKQLSVFGRRWQLQLQATPALKSQANVAPVGLILALGVLLSLLASLITHLVTATPKADLDDGAAKRGLMDFARSQLARWSLLALLMVGSAYAAFSWWQVRETVAARFERELQALADQRSNAGNTAIKSRKSALIFLSGTPPVNGLIRSDASGRDPLDGSSRRLWQQRMGQIFAAYGRANLDAQEVRLIRLAGPASQLVSWRRQPGERGEVLFDQGFDTTRIALLNDIRSTLLRGEAWAHPIETQNRPSEGKSDESQRQLLRYSMPVLDGEKLFGVLEMDIDISARFSAEALRLPWGGSLHVLSRDERWLSRQGLVEGLPGEVWSDRYDPISVGVRTPADTLRAWQSQQGEVLSAQSIVDPNAGDPSARVLYRAVVPMSAMQQQVVSQWQDLLWLPVLLAAALYSLLFLYWRLQQGHQGRLAALNGSLERRVIEQTRELLSERIRLSNILEGTGAGTWEWNCQSGETHFNARWAEILGHQLDALPPMIGEGWVEYLHPADLERTRQLLIAHFKGESRQYVCESRLRHRDGHWVWTLSSGRVMTHTPDGRAEWVSGTLLDISEMRAAQVERERFGNLLRGVLQAATDFSIIATEPDGLITVFNAGAEGLLGYTADEMVGRQTPAVMHVPDEVVQRGAELSAAEGQTVEGFRVFVTLPERQGTEQREWTYVRKDGSHVPVSLTVTVVRNERGNIVGYLGIAQDISARLAAERALRHAKTAAEAASAAKGIFLANMSHEIRTPMNAVIGIAHVLADTPLNEDQRQLLSKLQVAGRSLLGVINDVLDLSKIEAGELAVEQIGYQLSAVLRDLDAVFADQARAKGLSWEVASASGVPEALVGDPQRLKQVLTNLLSNAVKFTPSGEVSLHVERFDLDAYRQGLRFTVRDSGVGIPPEVQAQIFQPFAQAEASTTRRFGGTGLGLSIVKHLAGLMGGTVGLVSQPGKGSVFTLELPLQLHAHTVSIAPHRMETIVVEDDAVQRERLSALCSAFGWQARSFAEANSLLDLIQERHRTGQPMPDVLLVDWNLGDGLDGISAMRRLRALLPAGSVPAALLITQDERQALQTEDIDEVVDAVLAKPANPSTLFNAVNEAIAKRKGGSEHLLDQSVIQRLGGGLLPDVRLLVVDDSDINLEVARRMLERQGAVVLCDNHGEAALNRLAQGEVFDAVLMDIQMPGMDGLEATREIRERLQLRELTVIALTAGALAEERRRAMEAGMDDFLTKPLDPETLVRTLRRHIEARRGAPLPVRSSDAQTALPADWPLIDGIDLQGTVHRLGGDTALFHRLLARLLQSHDSEWVKGLVELPAEQAVAHLHKLRGSAGLLGAQRVQALAAEGEERLRDGATPAELTALLGSLSQSIAALHSAADAWLAQPLTTSAGPQESPLADAQAAFAELLSLLRRQDLEAGNVLQSLRLWLREQGLGAEELDAVERCVEDLDFEKALSLLEARGLGS